MKVQFEPEKKTQGTRDKGLQVPYGAGKRALPKWRWYLLLILVSSPLWYFAWRLLVGWIWVEAVAVVEARSWAELSQQSGRVAQILVVPGQTVDAGQVLVRLTSDELNRRQKLLLVEQTALQQQQQDWQQAQQQRLAQQAQLRQAASAPQIRPPLAQQRYAKQQVEFWQRRLTNMQWLQQRQAATAAEVASSRLQLEAALANLAALTASPNTATVTPVAIPLLAEPVPAELQLRQSQIATELQLIEVQLQQLQLNASQAGVVRELLVEPGQSLTAGVELLRLEQRAAPELRAYVAPRFHQFAQLGQSGRLKLPDGQSLKVTVSEVSPLTANLPARLAPVLSEPGPQLIVRLTSEHPLPETLRVNGLALPLVFDFSLTQRLGALLNPF